MEWAPAPVLEFIGDAQRMLATQGAHRVIDLRERFARLFGNSALLMEIANTLLRRIAHGQTNDGDPVLGNDILFFAYSNTMSLRLIKDRTDLPRYSLKWSADTLANYPADTLILVMSDRPMELSWYRLEDSASFDVFDSTLKIRPDGTEMIAPGGIIHVEARRRFPVMPRNAHCMMVALSGAPLNAQIVSFDPSTLQPLRASMSSDESSVLCVMLGLVDPTDSAYPLDAIAALTGHPDHHVRWAAASALAKRDRRLALHMFERLADNDPHVFVRRAAVKTLSINGGHHGKARIQ
jgi:hypothetical protein